MVTELTILQQKKLLFTAIRLLFTVSFSLNAFLRNRVSFKGHLKGERGMATTKEADG